MDSRSVQETIQRLERFQRKMDSRSVQETIQRLERFQRNFSLTSASMEEIYKLIKELRFLRTYLMYLKISEGKHCRPKAEAKKDESKVYDYYMPMSKLKLGSSSRFSSKEVEFIEANFQLHNAINDIYLCGERTSSADPLVTSMLQVVRDFESQVKDAYSVLLRNQSWELESKLSPSFWIEFTNSVLENLKDLLDSKTLIGSMRKSIESLEEKLKFLKNAVHSASTWRISCQKMGALLGYAQIAACLSYLFRADEMDKTMASGIEIQLSNLLQKITPSTPELIEMYFELLKASKPTELDYATEEKAVSFVNFLMDDSEGSMKDQFASIREVLAFLITFIMELPDECTEDQKQISADIQAVAREAVSFNLQLTINELVESQVKEMNHRLPRLLAKMNLIKAEIYLRGRENEQVVGMEDKFNALHEGLKFLRTFFVDFEGKAEDCNMFLSHVEEVCREVTALILSIFPTRKTERKMPINIDLALVLSLEKISLIKSEVCLMKLQNYEALKVQIEMLREGFAFLRAFLMDGRGIMDETEEGKVSLTYLQAVTAESFSLTSAFLVNDFPERMVNEFRFQLYKLVEKIKFIKAEVVLIELLNHDGCTTVQMKDQIKTLREALIFLKSFLMDPPREYKEDGEMILRKVESVVNEEASLICFLCDNVRKEDKAQQNVSLSEPLGKVMDLKGEIIRMYLHFRQQLLSKHPTTDGLGFISSLLFNLQELLNFRAYSIVFGKHQIEMLHEELDFLKSVLNDIVEQNEEHEELKAIRTSVIDIAYEAENVVDLLVIREGPLWHRMLLLTVVVEDINVIKAKAMETYDKTGFHKEVHNIAQIPNQMQSRARSPMIEEVVVGFSDEAEKIIGRLTRGSAQLDIVSIIGMPGLGKTTLAKKIYNDPSVTYHFHIRAWCCISQVYRRRELLLDILGDIVELTDRIHKMTDEEIADKLYRCLKGKRYLIVMDDLWDIRGWKDLRESFPNDVNGSRVLFTSRLHNVASQAKSGSHLHHLRLLSDDESWELMQEKLFNNEGCPEEFMEVGKVIAANCKGLPLALVVIAGLLGRTEKNLDWWKQVSQSLESQIVADPQSQFMHVLELSYKHLPDHLKSCFLHFGAFPDHKEFHVSKLLWLWIAEGFCRTSSSKNLEDSAEACLLDLISRSLVTVSKWKSNGGVKACSIHDLLRVLCVEKGKEENFLQLIHGYDQLLNTTGDAVDSHATYPLKYEKRRLCICSKRKDFTTLKPQGPCVRCLLFFASNEIADRRMSYDLSFISRSFKLIRVLDLESINMGNSFPAALEQLVLLRYLAVRGDVTSIPPSVARLWNLETLLIKGLRGEIELPYSFWSMRSLRHVHINDRMFFSYVFNELENSSLLDNVDTLSTPVLYSWKKAEMMMRRFPRLRKLRCIFVEEWDYVENCYKFPVLDFLFHLESLKVFYYGKACYPCELSFPLNIKKLTLSKFCLPWSEIETIGRLPNLEVLKLLFRAFEGKRWDVRDGEFPKLKYLKLDSLNICQWNASADHFSCLQSLVLQSCKKLEQVPSCLGEIQTLQMIQVRWCSPSATSSVRQIQEEQQELGNEELSVLIHPPEWANTSSS